MRINRMLSIKRKVQSLGNIWGILCLMMIAFTSCDVHQFPEINEPDIPGPDQPTNPTKVKLGLNLQYFTDFTYKDYTYDTKTGNVTAVSEEDGGTYDNLENLYQGTPMKVTVKVHRDNNNHTLVLSENFITELDENYDCELELEVPAGDNYLVTVWSHLLDENGEAFYDESDFNSIGLVKDKYKANTDMRDAYRGRLKVAAGEEGDIYGTVEMHRPMGKLEIKTTGLREFYANEEQRLSISTRAVDPDDYTVVISYPGYYPTNYMAMEDRLENTSTGYKFSTSLTIDEDDAEEASMGFDYILINAGDDEAVQASVTVLHSDGTQIASTGMITIPMKRDRHIVLRGSFLTANSGGGVGLDPDFDGDFNIPMY